MIKSKVLKKGSSIGLVAPSSPVTVDNGLERSIEVLKRQGFQVVVGDSCSQSYGYLSGSDEVRAADINKMFQDKSIDGIFCLKGGYGTPRILDLLNYEEIKKNPKVFIGYSDITAIHVALNKICKLITFHGPMAASDMIGEFDNFSMESYFKAITIAEPLGELSNPPGMDIKCMVKGKATGQVIGGNLSLLAATIGTPYEIDAKGKILFIEEISEATYRVDRMLTQLRLSGKLQECEGIIIGNFRDCLPESEDFDLTLEEVFHDIILPLQKPTIFNFMAGHCTPKITVPMGVEGILDADCCKFTLIESALTTF